LVAAVSDVERLLSLLSTHDLALVDQDQVRDEFRQWCADNLVPPPGSHRVLSFHSNYGGEKNGLFTVWSELYDREAVDGEPLDGSEVVVATDVAADSETAWALCDAFRRAVNAALPDFQAIVG
jgi:hypothetical protein